MSDFAMEIDFCWQHLCMSSIIDSARCVLAVRAETRHQCRMARVRIVELVDR